jgi:hypothetical protein
MSLALKGAENWRNLHQPHYAVEAYVLAADCALALGDTQRVRELVAMLEDLPPIERRPSLDAPVHRLRGRLADDGSADFAAAAAIFRGLGMRYLLAVTLAEAGGESLDEARAIFEQIGARPWLDRLSVPA